MSEVRRDSKGRKLWTGESQRKDGKYEYKYQDAFGVRRTVYSWKLTPADTIPKGKRNDLSLREKEKQIQKELDGNLVPNGGNLTVSELVEKYIAQKRGVRHNTKANYNFVINIIKKEAFGQHICEKYNKIYKVQMPKVTPHVCRHTFCSNMAKSGMNPKTLRYIMGHSDIGVLKHLHAPGIRGCQGGNAGVKWVGS